MTASFYVLLVSLFPISQSFDAVTESAVKSTTYESIELNTEYSLALVLIR